jgi:uncharacterized protein (TIGR03663 family)
VDDPPTDRRPVWWVRALCVIVGVALVVRLVKLGDRPMHHDESLDAWFSWRISRGEPYSYDPVYHGPLRFYLTGGLFRLVGDTEFTARLLAAACGAGTVALAGGLRRWLGDVGSLAAAAMLAVSPSMLYFSRFGREDVPFALLELALVAVAASWLTQPARWHPPVAGALLAAAFATKETSFIVVAVMGSYLGGLLVLELLDRHRGRAPAGPSVAATIRASDRRSLALGAAAFVVVFSACFSVGFTNPGGIVDGAVDGIRYWLSQQPVNRGDQPWPFYLAVLAGYEWPILPLAVVGAVTVVRRPDPVRGLLLWTAVANLIVYSWASERFPWLVVHPLLPIVLLAGIGIQHLWQRRTTDATPWARAVPATVTAVVAVVAGTVVALAAVAIPVAYTQASDPRHLLVSVQTSEDLPDVRHRLERLYAAAPDDDPLTVVVDTSNSGTWPWAWYLRDRPVLYADLADDPDAATDADVVIAMASNAPRLPAPPDGWHARPFAHRVWWLPPWSDSDLADWLRWTTTRRTFGPSGALQAVELERPGT